MKKKHLKCYTYIRVSTLTQADNFSLDVVDKHYERKVLDLQRRHDEQYDRIEEIELRIDELKDQIQSIRQEKISGDNIYQLLLMFDKVYYSCSEVEQKEFMKAFIEKIELYPKKREDRVETANR